MPGANVLFPGIELAARIERSEARLVAANGKAVSRYRQARGDAAAVFCRAIGGGVALHSGPASPMNKLAGLGFAGALDESELAAVEQYFDEQRTALQVELATLAEPSIGATLTRRGYMLMGFENVLGKALAPGAAVGGAVCDDDAATVALCDEADLAAWLDLVITGFQTPDGEGVPSHESFSRDEQERVFGEVLHTAGMGRYLAKRRGAWAGGGSLFLGEGVAHLCGAATLPAHRRRGVQSALLDARLRDAAARGFDLAVIVTQPGSKSQENAMRRGFQLLYSRAMLVREARG